MVLVVAVVLVGAALFFLMIGVTNAYPMSSAFWRCSPSAASSLFFAYAAGILRFATEDGAMTSPRRWSTVAGDAVVVASRRGGCSMPIRPISR